MAMKNEEVESKKREDKNFEYQIATHKSHK